MVKLYRYILVSDDGYAPCIDQNLLTLATCKPAIRSTANVGDWVIGYMPKALGEGLVVWAGRVQHKLDHVEYENKFHERKDANYCFGLTGLPDRVDPNYHPQSDQMRRDISAPVLIFDPQATWYFGANPQQPPPRLDPLKAVGQGHRVNFRLLNDVEDLEKWLVGISPPGILGLPRSFDEGDCSPGCGPKDRSRLKSKGGC